MSIKGTRKSRGRAATGRGTQVGLRWRPEDMAAIDAWRRKQDDTPGRGEAIRRLVKQGLKKG